MSSLQAVDAEVRLWEDFCSSFTPLARDREGEAACLQLPVPGAPPAALRVPLIPLRWPVARMPQVSSWITYSWCLSHY